MAIDVGSACINRVSYYTPGYTDIVVENPANATGVIDHIDLWMDTGGSVEVASFYGGGGTFSTRGYTGTLTAPFGDNNFNAPGDFTAFNINSGDYIGLNIISGAVEAATSGEQGVWDISGDKVPCTNQSGWTLYSTHTLSLYATGTEGGATYTKTLTTDAILAGFAFKTFTLDALLKAIQLKTTVVDGYLVNRFTKAFSVDSILFGVVKKTFEVDAVLSGLATYTKTFIVDGYLVKRITKTVVVDGWLKGSPKKTFLIDAVVGFAYEKKPLWYGKKYKVVGLRINLNEWKCELSLEEI